MFSSVSVRDDVNRIFTAAQRSKGRSPLIATILAFAAAMSLDRKTLVGNELNYPRNVIVQGSGLNECMSLFVRERRAGRCVARGLRLETKSAARTPVARIAELPAYVRRDHRGCATIAALRLPKSYRGAPPLGLPN